MGVRGGCREGKMRMEVRRGWDLGEGEGGSLGRVRVRETVIRRGIGGGCRSTCFFVHF